MKHKKFILSSIAAAMLLSGCGGGSSNRIPTFDSSTSVESAVTSNPNFASVTQSSRVDGATSTTLDSVALEYTSPSSYTVTKTDDEDNAVWALTQDDEIPEPPNAEGVEDSSFLPIIAARPLNGDASAVAVAFGYLSPSDLGLSDNDDYLTFGVWLQVAGANHDIAAAPVDIEEIGVFVDGEEFTAALPVSGSAQYNGNAGGVYYANGDLATADDFTAGVQFNANFRANNAHTVDGTMSNFVFNNGEDSLELEDALTLHFAQATFDSVQNGFVGTFNCLAGCANAGSSIAGGRWGGQFFGGASAVAEQPTAAPNLFAGTFGFDDLRVEHPDGQSATLDALGVFAAKKGPSPFTE